MSNSAEPQKPAPSPHHMHTTPAASQQAQSPYGGAPPPAKRPRLSLDARDPQSQPHQPYGGASNGLPTMPAPASLYGPSLTYSPNTFHASPLNTFNMPLPYQSQSQPHQSQSPPHQSHANPRQSQSQPHHQSQSQPQSLPYQSQPPHPQPRAFSASQSSPPPNSMMPPPPRPNRDDRDDRADPNDITDSLFGTGINLKDEENYLQSTYHNTHSSFATSNTTSFGSTTTLSPNTSFGLSLLTQGTSFPANGHLGGPVASQEDIQRELAYKREVAARLKAEKTTKELNNPFLQSNNLRHKMGDIAYAHGVRLDVQGLFNKIDPPAGSAAMVGADGQAIVVVRPEGALEENVPFADVLSLVSLAAHERLRALVDDAHALARARRHGSHGAVQPDFADIALGEPGSSHKTSHVVPESVTGSQWDRVPDDDASVTPTNADTFPNLDAKPPARKAHPSLTFTTALHATLRHLAARDEAAEAVRLRTRAARRRAATNPPTDNPNAEEPAPDHPAPDPVAPKLSKKELLRQAKRHALSTDAQLHSTTNQTAAMMALGKKAGRFAWMTAGAAPPLPTNRFVKPPPSAATGDPNPAGSKPAPASTASATAALHAKPDRAAWGAWRDDAPDAPGLQIRDWCAVLERDGRAKRALQCALNALA